jgi:glycosyltransferase involved in cell wall biosynthesis
VLEKTIGFHERRGSAKQARTVSESPGWVVVHDSARDHYQLPLAVAEAGLLERFVTDWYTPLDSPFWSFIAHRKLSRSALGIHSRYHRELPSSLISDRKLQFLSGLIGRRITREAYRDEVEGAKTGRLAAKIANERNAPVLATSYSAAATFAHLRSGLKRVLFQVHPHPRSLRRLYAKLSTQDPDYLGLSLEPEASVSEKDLKLWELESSLAEFVLCASQFSKRSLIEGGVDPTRIGVLPYGVDSDLFKFGRPKKDAPFTALFVGQKVARKGLRSLVRAWNELGLPSARLIVAGGHVRDQSLLAGFEGVYEEVPRTGLQQLIELYQQADVFVLPSVAEGFGHVYLEALSCGTPILCTENTGGADLIREGEDGWVVPVGDRAAIRDRLAWCASHRSILREMRESARITGEMHTWARFRQKIRAFLGAV